MTLGNGIANLLCSNVIELVGIFGFWFYLKKIRECQLSSHFKLLRFSINISLSPITLRQCQRTLHNLLSKIQTSAC